MNQDQRYYYDPETCSFVEVERTWTDYAAQIGQVLGLAVILAGLGVWLIDAHWVTSPKKETLEVENQALERQLDRVHSRMTTLASQLDTLAQKDRTLYRRLFQIEPISEDVRRVGVGGSDPYEEFDQMGEEASTILKKTAEKLDELERKMSLQGASYQELSRVAEERSARLEQLPAIRPANGPIVSGYGMRRHPVLKVRKMHEGVDFLVQRGTPVVSTGKGTVRRARSSPAYGNYVEIRHPDAGYITRYAHLSEIAEDVQPGTSVERGETIGYSGNSGRSTGPHLHYEVHDESGRTLDPMRFFVADMTPESYHELEERTESYESQIVGTEPAPSADRSAR